MVVNITISNKTFYSFVAIVILAVVGVVVYAASVVPEPVGHSASEIGAGRFPSLAALDPDNNYIFGAGDKLWPDDDDVRPLLVISDTRGGGEGSPYYNALHIRNVDDAWAAVIEGVGGYGLFVKGGSHDIGYIWAENPNIKPLVAIVNSEITGGYRHALHVKNVDNAWAQVIQGEGGYGLFVNKGQSWFVDPIKFHGNGVISTTNSTTDLNIVPGRDLYLGGSPTDKVYIGRATEDGTSFETEVLSQKLRAKDLDVSGTLTAPNPDIPGLVVGYCTSNSPLTTTQCFDINKVNIGSSCPSGSIFIPTGRYSSTYYSICVTT